MNYLSVEEVSKRYGEKVLFENITFGISKGQKVALVARNGTGKSSLMRIIAGLDTADAGSVVFRSEITPGFLEQDPQFDHSKTVLETVFTGDSPEIQAVKDYQNALKTNDEERIQEAFEKVDRLNAWDFEVRAKQIIDKLNTGSLHQPVGELSGGQVKRLALAHLLISEPDLLILDEPTNHLDLSMIEWLEEYLSQSSVTLFMVTHDRYFLDRVCNEILELDEGILHKYKGNYAYFLEKRDARMQNLAAETEKNKNILRKEMEWLRRQPKARGTKSKARIEAVGNIAQKASRKVNEEKPEFDTIMQRLGSKILELHNVVKAFDGKTLINGLDHKFQAGEKIGIVGPNGAGKSTLLKMILGEENVSGGKIVTGDTVVFGYYGQSGIHFKKEERVIEAVTRIAEFIPTKKGHDISAADLLERFLFPKNMHYQLIEKLSGGEKRRLYLLQVLMKNPNFLILDEPTNDLDILTLNVLENYLAEFKGCVIIVSHDRYFMDKIVDSLFVFQSGGRIRNFPGNYSQYRQARIAENRLEKKKDKEKQTQSLGQNPKKPEQPKKKLSFKEQREYQQLEKDIERLEKEKSELTEMMSTSSTDAEKLQKAGKRMGEIVALLEEKEMRWLELAEFV